MDDDFSFLVYWEVKVVIENIVADVNSFCVYDKSYIDYQPHNIGSGEGEEIGHTC